MPNRIIRDRILNSRKIASLTSWDVEILYRRLISVVDDFGRHTADEELLRPQLYPRQLDRVRASDVSRGLDALHEAGLIRCYEVEGEKFLVVTNWQEKPRAKKSKWPPLPEHADWCVWDASSACTCKHLHADASACATPSNTNSDSHPHSNSESKSYSGREGPGEREIPHDVREVKPGPTPVIPPCTLKEALDWASSAAGIREHVVRCWYDKRDRFNWLINGELIAKWQPDLRSFSIAYAEREAKSGKSRGINSKERREKITGFREG